VGPLSREGRERPPSPSNRKEAKHQRRRRACSSAAPARGPAWLIVDDVLTAGTAVRESLDVIFSHTAATPRPGW